MNSEYRSSGFSKLDHQALSDHTARKETTRHKAHRKN